MPCSSTTHGNVRRPPKKSGCDARRPAAEPADRQDRLVSAVLEHAGHVPLKPLCAALGVPRSTVHRHKRPRAPRPPRASERALEADEKQRIVDVLCEERFVDRSPAEVVHTLLDAGTYLCSERTMYRVLAERGGVKARRDQRSLRSMRGPNSSPPGRTRSGRGTSRSCARR